MPEGLSIVAAVQIHEVSDAALIAATRAGHSSAYTDLVGRYRNLVYAYVYAQVRSREEAEDLTQEVFVRAYMALETFRGSGSWGAWLMRIARNQCIDALRSKRIRACEPLSENWLDNAPTPEGRLMAAERQRQVESALNALPEKYRIPLLMHYASGQKCQEIALALAVPESTVKGRIATGVRRMRHYLCREG